MHHGANARLGGIKNGDPLRLAEGEFDLFVTSDQSIRYQQNLAMRWIAILELSNKGLRIIQAESAALLHAVASIASSEFHQLILTSPLAKAARTG